MTITLRQESADGATTKGSSLTYAELDNNFIHLLRQGSVTVRGDSGTDQTLGEADQDSILQIVGGTNVTTTLSSDSAGESVITIDATDAVGIANVVEDTTPQLGGDLDAQSNNITSLGTINTHTIPGGTGTFALTSDITGIDNVVEDTSPQLGGNLDVNNNSIVSTSNANINITPDGTGRVVLDGLNYPDADGTNGQFLQTDGANNLSFASINAIEHINGGTDITVDVDSAGGVTINYSGTSGIANVVEDTTPQLGGNLDCQGNEIQNAVLEDYAETVYSLGSTDSPTLNVSNGNVQSVTITSSLTLPAFSDAATGQSMTLLVSGSGSVSGTANHKFAEGNKTLTTDSVVSIFYDGTTYWTSVATNFSA